MQTAIDTTTLVQELNTPYEVPQEAIAFYRENGYVKLKNVLSPEVIDYYGNILLIWCLNSINSPNPWKNAQRTRRRFCKS